MKRINKTRYALLGMLSHQPMSGYDIKKALHMSTQYFWQESDGQIYPILAELLKEKCITSLAIESQGNRTRKVYQISSKGLEELKDWLVQEVVPTIPRNELLLKLFFGSMVPLEITQKHILEHQRQLKKRLETYKKIDQGLGDEKSPYQLYWQMTVEFGKQIVQAQLGWCQDALKLLKKIEQSKSQ